MTVNVYPSRLEGEPLELHHVSVPTTVGAWLRDNVNGYEPRDVAPISVSINGAHIEPEDWDSARFGAGDEVCIYPEPKGIETAIIALVAVLAAVVVTVLLQPSIPKQKANQSGKGDNLNEASLKGNKVKINSPIREIFGQRKVYPDYLVPNHRYFQSPKQQVVETMLSVGIGEFDIAASGILIGDTTIASLGDDASYAFYQPGENVSSDSRAQWWHSAPEIGATSTGSAGLEVVNTIEAAPVANASSYVLSGYTISIPPGAGSLPTSWEPGMIVSIDARYPYTISDGVGPGVRDVVSGDIAQLGFSVGALIEIAGDNAGEYIVHDIDGMAGTMTLNYSDGSPTESLVVGSKRMAISFRGLRYRITSSSASSITLERLTDTGSVDGSWPGFSDLTIDDAVIRLDATTQQGGWLGPFSACPSGELTTLIEWDVFFPGGIIFIGDDGWIAPPFYGVGVNIIRVQVQYRDAEMAGAWTSVIDDFSSDTLDQLGYTRSATLPYPMRPEVRMRRIGAKSTNPSVQDTVQWYGLRSKLSAPSSYQGVTTLAIKVAGGGKVSAQSEQLVSVLATRKLPTRVHGAWTAPVATRDIAPAVAYIGKSLGYSDADLDLTELDRLDSIWKARGDTFDQSFESTTTAKEAINNALRAGFAEMTIDRGRIRPVRDEPRTVFEHLYTPQNCTEILSREFQAVTPDDFDGVDVEYTDDRTWQVETVECRLPGDLGLRTEKIQVEGVTSRTRAWRIGMRARMAQKYRRYRYSTATELDALNSRYLSYVALADDIPGYGKSALLLAWGDLGGSIMLQSSEPFDWVTGASHVVAIRRPDGSVSGPHAATRIDDYRLTIPSIDFTPDTSWEIEPPHLLFGTSDRWTYPALITDISPRGDSAVSITAINYAPEVYTYDDSAPS